MSESGANKNSLVGLWRRFIHKIVDWHLAALVAAVVSIESYSLWRLWDWVKILQLWQQILLVVVLVLIIVLTILVLQRRKSDKRSTNHWTERKQLEISVLANVSANREPTATPIENDPENSRLREMKDAILMNELDATLNGERPNVMSTVTLKSFEQYVAATNKTYWIEVLHRWQGRHERPSASSRISLIELAKEAEKRGWELLNPKKLHTLDFFDAVRQLGVDGNIEISGRPAQMFVDITKSQPLVPITAKEWMTHEIDVFAFFKWKNSEQNNYTDDNFETNVKCLSESGPEPRYFDIHLERAAALEWLDTEAIHFRGRRED